jgi:beta-glucosidase
MAAFPSRLLSRPLSRLFRIGLFCLLTVEIVPAQVPVYKDPAAPVAQRVSDLLGRMTLDEKIGQMMQVDHPAVINNPSDVTKYFMGSVLSGGGSDIGDNKTSTWAALHDTMQVYALKTRLGIPMIYGIDAVHGNNNIVGATVFPHNIGLGCTRDSALVYAAARVTAEEVAATGIEWTFAPCIAVPRNERWGRTYEGFGETPELARTMGAAAVLGFQGDSLNGPTSIVACAKHFIGDGGTTNGSNAGNTQCTEAELRSIHLPGYRAAIDAGAGSIMVSFNSWNGSLLSGNAYLLTTILKGELGFKGFLVSDWGAIDYLGSNFTQDVAASINAGMDMVMLPYRYQDFQTAMRTLVGNGTIPMSRVDDAVARILTVKFAKGLFERPFANKALQADVGSAAHRAVARKCVRESIVLLKNNNNALPLLKLGKRILVAGSHANNIGNQCGGWTISWQGTSGNITPGTTILQGMINAASGDQIAYSLTGDFTDTKADYSVVVVGEPPYAEGTGDRSDISLAAADVSLITKMKGYGNPVVVILVTGRPMIIGGILSSADAIMATWLPGTEGDGVADVLFGDYNPHGVLSHSWPRTMAQLPINIGDAVYDPLYAYGYGLTYSTTAVKGREKEMPGRYALDQNFPNPFNPSTTITFSVPVTSFVTLKVFNALGREVSMLVHGELQAGTYTREMNGELLPSGVYFYRLQAGGYTETKRCIMVK